MTTSCHQLHVQNRTFQYEISTHLLLFESATVVGCSSPRLASPLVLGEKSCLFHFTGRICVPVGVAAENRRSLPQKTEARGRLIR